MKDPVVNLREAKPGDTLLSCHGIKLTYLEHVPEASYPHIVQYPDGGMGSRLDNGCVFKKNRLPTDHDIIRIIPRVVKPLKTKKVSAKRKAVTTKKR